MRTVAGNTPSPWLLPESICAKCSLTCNILRGKHARSHCRLSCRERCRALSMSLRDRTSIVETAARLREGWKDASASGAPAVRKISLNPRSA